MNVDQILNMPQIKRYTNIILIGAAAVAIATIVEKYYRARILSQEYKLNQYSIAQNEKESPNIDIKRI